MGNVGLELSVVTVFKCHCSNWTAELWILREQKRNETNVLVYKLENEFNHIWLEIPNPQRDS